MAKSTSTILVAAALGVCLLGGAAGGLYLTFGNGSLLEAPAAKAPAPSMETLTAQSAPTPDQIYAKNHQGAVAALTQLKTVLASDKATAALSKLATAVGQLPGLQTAYVNAKKTGNDADTKAALAAYTKAAQSVVEMALPLEQLAQANAGFNARLDAMGPIGAKLRAEADVAALLKDIGAALKPVTDANTAVGPVYQAASESAQTRLEAEAAKIFGEEFSAQVQKMLDGQAPAAAQ